MQMSRLELLSTNRPTSIKTSLCSLIVYEHVLVLSEMLDWVSGFHGYADLIFAENDTF